MASAIAQNTWNGHAWSREDDRGHFERVEVRRLATKHKLSISQVYGASNGSVSLSGGTVTFTFTSTVESNLDIDLTIAVAGTAVNGDDYSEVLPDDVVISAGNRTATLQVQMRRDRVVEVDEQLVVSVVPEAGNPPTPHYQPGSPSSATVTIESSDLPKITLVGGGRIPEGGAGGFSFVSDVPVSQNTSINYSISGTATPGSYWL